MQREEATKCLAAIMRSFDDQPLQLSANHGRDGHDVSCHFRRPVALLVPGQQVAGERECEHQQQEEESEPVIDFARGFVSPIDEDLHQVEHEQDVHCLRCKMMNASQKPAANHLVLDVVNTFPRSLRTGTVRHPEENPGDELYRQCKRKGAPPHITPARAARHIFKEGFVENLFVTGAVVKPPEQGVHAGSLAASPARKFWNFTQTSVWLRISTFNSSKPRGAGLEGELIWPVRAKVLLWQGQL